jgi:hypothetical protein
MFHFWELPMAHIERRLTFHSSPHDVFASLIDIEARPEWRPDIKRAYLTSRTPLAVGTTFVLDAVFMGQTFQTIGKVIKYNPDAEFAYVYAEGIVAGVWNYRITPIDSGAQLEVAIDFIEPARLMRWLKRLLRPILRRIINRNIDRFHIWVERKHAPST